MNLCSNVYTRGGDSRVTLADLVRRRTHLTGATGQRIATGYRQHAVRSIPVGFSPIGERDIYLDQSIGKIDTSNRA